MTFKSTNEVIEMNMPGFTAEESLGKSQECYRYYGTRRSLLSKDAVVLQGRITCGSDVALGALCTALGAPAFIFPCFGNTGCLWFHAGLIFPPCFGCSFTS